MLHRKKYVQGTPNNFFFFLENALKKKLLNIFSNFFFYLKVQSIRFIMENNFIQMAAPAGHAVAYTIGPILKHIIDCDFACLHTRQDRNELHLKR